MRENASPPTSNAVDDALTCVGDLLGIRVAFAHAGRYHFPLGDGKRIAVSSESAGRLRVDAWHGERCTATLWTRIEDTERLAGLVLELAGHLEADAGARA